MGVHKEKFQDGPSFYRHVRGNAAGGEGRERRTVSQVGDAETVVLKSTFYLFASTSNSCVIREREEQMAHVTQFLRQCHGVVETSSLSFMVG